MTADQQCVDYLALFERLSYGKVVDAAVSTSCFLYCHVLWLIGLKFEGLASVTPMSDISHYLLCDVDCTEYLICGDDARIISQNLPFDCR